MSIPSNLALLIEPALTAVTTLFAAYFGAKYAFQLQRKRELEDIADTNAANANLVIFTLLRFHNLFLNIKLQVIGDMEDNEHRHHFIKPMLAVSWPPPDFSYEKLTFLFKSDPNLLNLLATLQNDLSGTIDLIRERSKIHYEELQPAVERVQRTSGDTISTQAVENEMGQRMTQTLIISTNYMVDGINRAIKNTKDHAFSVRKAAKTLYPNHKFIALIPSDK